MINFKVFLFVCMLIGGGYGQGNTRGNVNVDPQPPEKSSLPPQPTPTTANVTTPAPTTPNPNVTTTISPNTTTVAPITTSVAPNTTTVAPNTTTVAPNTTTVAPITTSTAKPTTPSPTPAPVDPKVGNWSVDYVNTTRSCIILKAAAQFEVQDTKNKTVKINIPVNATASGTCEGNNTQTLVVSWGQNNSVTFNFEKTNSSKFDLNNIVSTLNVPESDAVYTLIHNKTEFTTPLKNSYKCARTQTLDLTKENSNVTFGHLHVSHLQYQAFHNSTESKFDSALDCESTSTPDVVPIVVGCVLAALVVAVLVAYLFGRRRCQARGYLSMFEETRREEDYIPMKNLSCFN